MWNCGHWSKHRHHVTVAPLPRQWHGSCAIVAWCYRVATVALVALQRRRCSGQCPNCSYILQLISAPLRYDHDIAERIFQTVLHHQLAHLPPDVYQRSQGGQICVWDMCYWDNYYWGGTNKLRGGWQCRDWRLAKAKFAICTPSR